VVFIEQPPPPRVPKADQARQANCPPLSANVTAWKLPVWLHACSTLATGAQHTHPFLLA